MKIYSVGLPVLQMEYSCKVNININIHCLDMVGVVI